MSGRTAKAARRAASARSAVQDVAIEAVWARVPDAGCKGLCQDCCGPIGMSEAERARIARRHGLTIRDAETQPGTSNCPALTDGTCRVYPDRPTVCRLWGASAVMPCPHGCIPAVGHLSPADSARIMRDSIAIDGSRAGVPPGLLEQVVTHPVAGPLFSAAMRGDRTAYPALAATIRPILEPR